MSVRRWALRPAQACVCVLGGGGAFMATVPFPLSSDRSGSTPPRCFRLALKTSRGRPRPLRLPPAPRSAPLLQPRGTRRGPWAHTQPSGPDRPSGTCHRRWAPRARHLCTRVMPRFFPSPSASCPFALFTPASVSEVSLSVILDSSTAPGDKRTRQLFPDGAVDLGNSERPPGRRRERSTLSNPGPRLFLFLHSVGLWFPQCVPD